MLTEILYYIPSCTNVFMCNLSLNNFNTLTAIAPLPVQCLQCIHYTMCTIVYIMILERYIMIYVMCYYRSDIFVMKITNLSVMKITKSHCSENN